MPTDAEAEGFSLDAFSVDNEADAAFRDDVRGWIGENAPPDLCNRSYRVPPDELKP